MAGTSQTTTVRRRLYSFARRLASPFTDSRRQDFVTDMVTGLIAAGHVHLTAIARALGEGTTLHAAEKRLSRHLGSEHWDLSPLADLRDAVMNHAWRLRKSVTYLFDWIATLLRELLHRRPKLNSDTG